MPRPRSTPSRVLLPGRFSSVFPSLNMAVKRREQALQDYKRLQSKVEKYEEKERTGPVLAKLHQVQPRSLGATLAASFVATWEPRWVRMDLFQSHAELSGLKMKGNKKSMGRKNAGMDEQEEFPSPSAPARAAVGREQSLPSRRACHLLHKKKKKKFVLENRSNRSPGSFARFPFFSPKSEQNRPDFLRKFSPQPLLPQKVCGILGGAGWLSRQPKKHGFFLMAKNEVLCSRTAPAALTKETSALAVSRLLCLASVPKAAAGKLRVLLSW